MSLIQVITRRILVVFILLLLADVAAACSVCRSGDDRFFLNGAQRINDGNFILMAEYFSTSKTSGQAHQEGEEGLLRTGSLASVQHTDGALEAHDQQVYRALFLYGLIDRITLLVSVQYTTNKIDEGGESETSGGFGDPEVTLIADLFESDEGDFELNAVMGTRIPLGNGNQTDENGKRLEQHLQSGTGAWGVTGGVQAAHTMLVVPLFYGVNYQINGTNTSDFSYGNVLRLNIATQVPVSRAIRILAEGNLRYAAKDKAGSEFDPNSGGTIFYFSPGLKISVPGGLALRAQIQIPVVEDLFGVQDEKTNIQVGLSIEL